MKFLILGKKGIKKQMLRVFLEDGTELTGLVRLELSGQPAHSVVAVTRIDEKMAPPDRFDVQRLTLEFWCPEVEFIDKPPK